MNIPDSIPVEVREVAQMIGTFYLSKNNGDYEAAEKEIDRLRIAKIEVADGVVFILSARPGILIGKRGENIGALQEHLGKKIKIFEEKDSLRDYLITYPETDYADSHWEWEPEVIDDSYWDYEMDYDDCTGYGDQQ